MGRTSEQLMIRPESGPVKEPHATIVGEQSAGGGADVRLKRAEPFT
jgi:hypothetical protein